MSRGISKQVERGEGDQKQVGRSSVCPAERRQHCLSLRTRQRVDVPLDRPRQLMQPGERELGFGLDPRGGQNLKPARLGPGAGGAEQGGLANAWLAEHDERSAIGGGPGNHVVELSGLSRATIERELIWRV